MGDLGKRWDRPVPNVRFSHHGGHCSYYGLLNHYERKDRVLHRIARIIDEADTAQQVMLEPAATGLDLICEGLRLIRNDNREAIERGRVIYDALYTRLQRERNYLPSIVEGQRIWSAARHLMFTRC